MLEVQTKTADYFIVKNANNGFETDILRFLPKEKEGLASTRFLDRILYPSVIETVPSTLSLNRSETGKL